MLTLVRPVSVVVTLLESDLTDATAKADALEAARQLRGFDAPQAVRNTRAESFAADAKLGLLVRGLRRRRALVLDGVGDGAVAREALEYWRAHHDDVRVADRLLAQLKEG